MILVDSSVWIDHLRKGDATLARMLDSERVLAHPFGVRELALGSLRQRKLILAALENLPQATVASDSEVLRLIHQEALHGQGIGYVDAHLLASARLTANGSLWTRDRRLRAIADRLGLATAF